MGKFIGRLFYMEKVGLMIRSCQGQVSFTNTFSSYLKTVNLKIFANHKGIYTWRQSSDRSTELWKYLFLKLIIRSFQMLCLVQTDLAILFVKLTAQKEYWIWKMPSAHDASGVRGFHAKPFLFVISWKVICTLIPRLRGRGEGVSSTWWQVWAALRFALWD